MIRIKYILYTLSLISLINYMENNVSIKIKIGNDKTLDLTVRLDMTVENLKKLLETEHNIYVEDKLFFGNNKLEDNKKKLSDYGIINNSELHVVLRTPMSNP